MRKGSPGAAKGVADAGRASCPLGFLSADSKGEAERRSLLAAASSTALRASAVTASSQAAARPASGSAGSASSRRGSGGGADAPVDRRRRRVGASRPSRLMLTTSSAGAAWPGRRGERPVVMARRRERKAYGTCVYPASKRLRREALSPGMRQGRTPRRWIGPSPRRRRARRFDTEPQRFCEAPGAPTKGMFRPTKADHLAMRSDGGRISAILRARHPRP